MHTFTLNYIQPTHCFTVLEEIQSTLRILLSESNKQQQDLDMIKDDHRTLKFGSSTSLMKNSVKNVTSNGIYKLKQLQTTLEEQGVDIDCIIQSLEDSDHPCGDRDWINVVNLDMADPNQNCPSAWMLTDYSKHTCGRRSTD